MRQWSVVLRLMSVSLCRTRLCKTRRRNLSLSRIRLESSRTAVVAVNNVVAVSNAVSHAVAVNHAVAVVMLVAVST